MSRKFQNVDWTVDTAKNGVIADWEMVRVSVLMDIRDELQKLNALLHCSNFVAIPQILRRVSANTAKPRKTKS